MFGKRKSNKNTITINIVDIALGWLTIHIAVSVDITWATILILAKILSQYL